MKGVEISLSHFHHHHYFDSFRSQSLLFFFNRNGGGSHLILSPNPFRFAAQFLERQFSFCVYWLRSARKMSLLVECWKRLL